MHPGLIPVFLTLPLIVIATAAPNALATDEPDFQSVYEQKPFEIRHYPPLITASILVETDAQGAGNAGFRPLADYIFGNNTKREKIEMTAPVVQSPSGKRKKSSEKIDMTAPVTQTQTGDGKWRVSFIMPEKWTLETLPKPNNPDIIIEKVPAQMLAVIRFSGGMNAKRFSEREAELKDWLTGSPGGVSYRQDGVARYAFYNGPWVPGPFKRNEIMIPVMAPSDDAEAAGRVQTSTP